MRYFVFGSGSKGNCTLIASKGKYLVIDNGFTIKRFKSYIASVNVELKNLNVVLVTHSHSDHTAGLKVFDDHNIYATKSTYENLVDELHMLIPYHEYDLNGFHILVVPTSHDATGSVGFIIEADGEKLVYITDTGYLYDRVTELIRNADYYIFESNHDVRMQLQTGRPQYLIDRIMGDYGHLSNEDSALYLSDAIGPKTKEIVLAHLSEEANDPDVAMETFKRVMMKRKRDITSINVRCAKQNEATSGGKIDIENL